jgi:adenine-specific DNA-methyltransferase
VASAYEGKSREDLIALIEKLKRRKKFGLIWERDEIEHDLALDSHFVALTPDESLHEGPAPHANLVIEGDNFDALRWLAMTHQGRVKCIYIDPPYNTGNKDWVYNDRYMDKENAYRHSTWLEFLFRRLSIARDLLRDDGVMLISINDENRAKLEMLLDEVMPGMNRGSLVWRSRTGGNEGGDHFFSVNHEHVLVYSHGRFRFGGAEKTFDMYSNPDNDPRGDWRSDNLTKAHNRIERPNTFFPLFNPETETWYPCNPDSVWRYTSKKTVKAGAKIRTKFMEDWIKEGRIIFPAASHVVWNSKAELLAAIRSGNVPTSGPSKLIREDLPDLNFWIGKKVGFGTPAFKRFKADLKNANQPLSSWVTPKSETDTLTDGANAIVSGTTDEGSKAIKDVFGEKAFNYAKPPSLIRELVRQSTGPGDLVMDFFAGSATTAQAVMELNAEDDGGRKFILVSSTEANRDEPEKNLCRDVTAMRIRHLNASTDPKFAELQAGFAYLRAREIPLADVDYELEGAEIWAALLGIHNMAQVPFRPKYEFMAHESGHSVLVYANKVRKPLRDGLEKWAKAGRSVAVYTWAPGQLREFARARNVEVNHARQVLVSRFRK